MSYIFSVMLVSGVLTLLVRAGGDAVTASMLAGAALLLVCDLVAKLLALPINTITALMGIPVVIYVVVRNRNIF